MTGKNICTIDIAKDLYQIKVTSLSMMLLNSPLLKEKNSRGFTVLSIITFKTLKIKNPKKLNQLKIKLNLKEASTASFQPKTSPSLK